jgi:hypothetical protein
LIAAALLFVISSYVPFGDIALYPLTLFATWVHEMGHGITALVVGGRFDSLDIFRNASGLAHCYASAGWPEALVCAGGLLAPPIVGASILAFVHGPKRARIVLALLAAALVLSMVLYVRSVAGLVSMPIVAAALAWAAWRGVTDDPDDRVVIVQVLGVVLALDTLTRMVSYVFMSSVTIDGVSRPTDIQMVSDNLGGSYILWGMAITVIAVGLLALASWWAWRRPAHVTKVVRAMVRPTARPTARR